MRLISSVRLKLRENLNNLPLEFFSGYHIALFIPIHWEKWAVDPFIEISNCGKFSLTDVNTIIWVSCLLADVQGSLDSSRFLSKLSVLAENGMIQSESDMEVGNSCSWWEKRREREWSGWEWRKTGITINYSVLTALTTPLLLTLQNSRLTPQYQHGRNVNRRRLVTVKTSLFFATNTPLEVFLRGKLETTWLSLESDWLVVVVVSSVRDKL